MIMPPIHDRRERHGKVEWTLYSVAGVWWRSRLGTAWSCSCLILCPTNHPNRRIPKGCRVVPPKNGDIDPVSVRKAFRSAVNMAPAEIERWLTTDRSKQVGQKKRPASEATGHASGRRIVELRRRPAANYTDSDYRFMTKVIGYVARHSAQRPDGDVIDTKWRASLMNWGHDPIKHDRRTGKR